MRGERVRGPYIHPKRKVRDSKPDLVVTNNRHTTVHSVEEGIWSGASDHGRWCVHLEVEIGREAEGG